MSTNIIIPATASSDYPMSEHSDPFTVDIISNSFPLSTENEVSEEADPFEHLELSPNKRYALWRKDTVEYWNPWWRQVLSSSKTDGKFGYFVWSKAKRSAVWEHFEQGANIQNGSPNALCKVCWKVFATLSFGLVVVVHLLFSAMPSIRNVVAQKLVKDCCCNLEREL